MLYTLFVVGTLYFDHSHSRYFNICVNNSSEIIDKLKLYNNCSADRYLLCHGRKKYEFGIQQTESIVFDSGRLKMIATDSVVNSLQIDAKKNVIIEEKQYIRIASRDRQCFYSIILCRLILVTIYKYTSLVITNLINVQ